MNFLAMSVVFGVFLRRLDLNFESNIRSLPYMLKLHFVLCTSAPQLTTLLRSRHLLVLSNHTSLSWLLTRSN